jgi:hypothetical protein
MRHLCGSEFERIGLYGKLIVRFDRRMEYKSGEDNYFWEENI